MPTRFQHCENLIRETTSKNLPLVQQRSRVNIVIPELPAFKVHEEVDWKFKNRLIKNIEQAKELKQNILFLPNLLEPEEDSEELPEMTSG